MPRVIVVGAGLAGLAAAQELRNKGLEVVVVEARDRVGGRVWTSHFNEGTATDLGASFIHGVSHNPIAEFADILKRDLHARASCTLFDEDGTKVIPRIDKRVEQLFNETLTKACERRKHYRVPNDDDGDDDDGDDDDDKDKVKGQSAGRPRVETTGPGSRAGSSCTDTSKTGMFERSQREVAASGQTSPDSSSGSNVGCEGGKPVCLTDDNGHSRSNSGPPAEGLGTTREEEEPLLAPSPSADESTAASSSSVSAVDSNGHADVDESIPKSGENCSDESEIVASEPSPSAPPVAGACATETAAERLSPSGRVDESLEDAIQAELPEPLEGVELRAFNWHMANLEYSVCADLKDVSNRDWDQDDVYGFGGAHCVVKGGMGNIARNLARGLDIRFNCPVKRIRYLSDKVSVEIGPGQHFDADACLVTLPLGVLKAGSVTFSPPLPAPKVEAISRLGFGILNKVVLLFPRVFWDAGDFIGYMHSQRGTFPMFVDVSEAAGRPMLIALISGSPAIDVERFTETGACKLAMDVLHKIFKARTLRPLQCIVTRWHSDPYALGSYSYVQVNGSADDYDALAAPVASRAGAKRGASFRLFFAGEATNRYYPATVHGAFLSGIREAKRIVRSLRVQTQVKRESLTSNEDGTVVASTTTPVMKMDRSMGTKGRMGVRTAHRTNVDNLSRAHIKAHILHQHSFAFPPKGDFADRIRRPPGSNPRVPLPLATPNTPGAEDAQGQVWPKSLSDRLHGCAPADLPSVGDYVLVNWSEDQRYYGGHVTKLDEASGRAGVLYDDGEYEELNLSKEGFKFPPRTGPQPLKWKPSPITDDDMVASSVISTAPRAHTNNGSSNTTTTTAKARAKSTKAAKRRSGAGAGAGGKARAAQSREEEEDATEQQEDSPRRHLQHLRRRKRVCYRHLNNPTSGSSSR